MAYSSIAKPSDYFNTVLYTGNGSTNAITGVGFQPDWTWTKRRDSTGNHSLYDAVRGVTKRIESDTTDVEQTVATSLTAFNTDGFTLGSGGDSNGNSETYASWNWLGANGTTSNSDGSITSTVSANQTAGFSIVKYTGTGSAGTVGHGLGVAPKTIIVKCLDAAKAWTVYHSALGSSAAIFLEQTSAATTSNTTYFGGTDPTASVFSIGTSTNVTNSGDEFIAYCFAEKTGYSKFGSYTGNGNADGTFVYTGFKPAWVLVKRSDASESWFLYDNKRNAYTGNERYYVLRPNTNLAENTTYSDNWQMDFLSNGFKLRTTAGHLNSGNLIYMAFAENPFVGNDSGTAVPGTAI